MKKLLLLILLAGTFTGGFICGAQSSGVDLTAEVERSYNQAVAAAGKLAAVVTNSPSDELNGQR